MSQDNRESGVEFVRCGKLEYIFIDVPNIPPAWQRKDFKTEVAKWLAFLNEEYHEAAERIHMVSHSGVQVQYRTEAGAFEERGARVMTILFKRETLNGVPERDILRSVRMAVQSGIFQHVEVAPWMVHPGSDASN